MYTDGSYLVTGGLGFIGSHLCERLLSYGAHVVAVDNLDAFGPYPVHFKEANLEVLEECAEENKNIGALLTFVRADVSDQKQIRKLFDTCDTSNVKNITRVCHLSARSGIAASFDDVAGAVVSNVASTASLLAVASEFGVESFVLGSSGSVYGDNAMGVMDSNVPIASIETDSTDTPMSPYAASKRAAELFAYSFWRNNQNVLKRVTVCRIFTVYGPRGRPDMAVFRFIHSCQNGTTLFRFGDGKSTWRDYAHVADVADGLLRAMHRGNEDELEEKKPSDGFCIVNVASGVPTRLREVIDCVTSACGGDPINVEERPGRPGDVGGTFADVSRAEEVLGWRPRVEFEDGIKETAAWYESFESKAWREP